MEFEQNLNVDKKRNTVILYSCGICNLNCSYCCIDKNPALKIIDDKLGKSFEGNYYFDKIKTYFPTKGQLKRLETWGGEPFLKMERVHNLLRQIINYYPYFNTMFSSTNFSFSNWNDKFFELMSVFGEFPIRRFTFELQLSIDGPEYINDSNRGKGTTKKCLDNFKIFISRLKELPKNIDLRIMTKGTLDNRSLMLLDSKEKIIEYYQFLEKDFINPIRRLNQDNIKIAACVPNTAVPSPVTKEIGLHFAQFCKWCREIEKENNEFGYFKFYSIITPFSSDNQINKNYWDLTYICPTKVCGSGSTMIGLLPDDVIATCHESFTHLVKEYKKDFQESEFEKKSISFKNYTERNDVCKYCMSNCQYENHELQMSYFNKSKTTFLLGNIVLEIITLAMCNQIDSKYLDEEKALVAAKILQDSIAFCIKDNYNITGTITIIPNGIIKLFLNGAIEEIAQEQI